MTSVEIDHVAIVVKDLDATLRLYTQTLGFKQVYREIVDDQGVEALGLEAGGSFVELLLPLDEASPIAALPGRRPPRSSITPPIALPTSKRRSRSLKRRAYD